MQGAPGRQSWTEGKRAKRASVLADGVKAGPPFRGKWFVSKFQASQTQWGKGHPQRTHQITPALLQRHSDHGRTQEATLAARPDTPPQGSFSSVRRIEGKEETGANIQTPLPHQSLSRSLGVCPSPERAAPSQAGCNVKPKGPQPSESLLSGPEVPFYCTSTSTAGLAVRVGRPGMWGGDASLPGAHLPGHRLRDGSRAHWHLDPLLPLLPPGVCQHVVLIRVQLEGVMQLHGGDQVRPKHLERETQGH